MNAKEKAEVRSLIHIFQNDKSISNRSLDLTSKRRTLIATALAHYLEYEEHLERDPINPRQD